MSRRNEGNWNSAVLAWQLTQKAKWLDLPDRLVSARREISGRIVFTTSFGVEVSWTPKMRQVAKVERCP